MFFQLALPLILGKVWAQMNLSSVAPSTGLLQWFLAPKCFMYFFWYILIWDVDIFGIRLLIWLDLIRFDLTCRMRASFRILRDMCLEKEGTNPTKFTAQFTSHSTVLKTSWNKVLCKILLMKDWVKQIQIVSWFIMDLLSTLWLSFLALKLKDESQPWSRRSRNGSWRLLWVPLGLSVMVDVQDA